MKKFSLVFLLAACGAPVLDEPAQAQEQAIAQFVSDVAPELSPVQQAAVANCGAQNTTTEELQRLAALEGPLDAASTGLISEIMTRDGTLACMASNGVSL